jgi:EmrB/QacA subfamily drug resistance transporter
MRSHVSSPGPGLAAAAAAIQLTPRHRGTALGICCISVLLVGIDMTAVNVALPSIGREFHTGASGLSWTIDAYTLVLAAFLMFSASAADRFGRKRVFRTGLVTFVAGSALCAVAPDLGWLVGFRMIQALGGSMLNPVAMAILSHLYPERAQRARAIGVWAGAIGLALALGPVVGGALVSSPLGWRWIFVINIPIGLAAAIAARWVVPESKADHPRRFDPAGQVLVAAMLACLTYGIIEGPRLGWSAPVIIAAFAVSAVSLAGIIWYEPRRSQPLLELRFFRSIPFSAANLIAVAAFAALGSFLYLNSIYLQEARGYSALDTGLLTLPLAVVSVIWGPVNGRVLARYGSRVPLALAGLALLATGLILATVTTSTSIIVLLVAYAAMGLGNSAVGAPITHTAVAGMPPAQAGVAAGVSSTARQVGQTIGVAVAGATIAAVPIGHAQQLAVATHTGWWLIAAYGLTILILGILSTTAKAKATAEHALPATPPGTAADGRRDLHGGAATPSSTHQSL